MSPDDQGFWNAKGVTLDYVMAFVAWDLNLADLKQGLREIQRQQEKEEAFMKFIVKQANRVNYEEASVRLSLTELTISHNCNALCDTV